MSGDGSSQTITNSNGKSKFSISRIAKQIENKFRSLLKLPAPTLKESLEEIIEEHEGEVSEIPVEERTLLKNVLGFSELTVENIMIPRGDIVFVKEDVSLDDLKKSILEKAHTRIPVCRETLDDTIGFIHTKDLVETLCDGGNFDIRRILREALFVPTSMRVSDLLLKMRADRVHIALVVDEYGGTTGMVTLEDVMEEIVGEIEDEHDTEDEEMMCVEIAKGVYNASSRIDIETLENILSTKFRSDDVDQDFDTLGGMIFYNLSRVPSKGEIVSLQDSKYEMEILDADPRHIKRVIIRKR